MMSDRDLFDAITNTALEGCDVNVSTRQNAIWNAACVLMADVLRQYDPFNRERLLRGIEAELRESIAHLDELLRPPPRKSVQAQLKPRRQMKPNNARIHQ